MPWTVELPDELANALTVEATRLGLSLPDYTVRLLTSARPSPELIQRGSDLVDYWRAEGLIGSRPDVADSSSEARRLRDQAQRRGA